MAVTMFGTDDVRLSGWSLDNIVSVGIERQDTGRLLVIASGGQFVELERLRCSVSGPSGINAIRRWNEVFGDAME